MNSDRVHVKIITHEQIVYENDVDELYVKSKDGYFGILRNHIPVICALDIGVTRAIDKEKTHCIATMGGVLQFSNNQATILTDCADLDCDIDVTRAKQAKERAQARLKAKNEEVDIPRAQLALARATARISAVEKRY